MKNNFLLPILLLFFLPYNFLLGQENKGYFGSKVYVQAITLHRIPIFQLGNESGMYDFGFAGNVTYQASRNLGLQLEVGREFFNPKLEDYRSYGDMTGGQYFQVDKLQAFDAKSLYIMPKLVLSNAGSIQPLGFSQELGFGVHFGRLVDQRYRIDWNTYNTQLPSIIEIDTKKNKATRYFSLMYGMNYHVPLAKKLMLGFHFQYMVHFGFPDKQSYFSSSGLYSGPDDFKNISQADQDYTIRRNKGFHFATFGLGLCYSI